MQGYGWTWWRGGRLPPVRRQGFSVSLPKSSWSIIRLRGEKTPSKRCVSHVRIFNRYFGEKRLTDITVHDVQAFQADQVRQGKAPASVNRYVGILSQMFALAIQWGQMHQNPVKAVACLRVRNARTRFLSDEEEDILLKACGPAIKPVVIAALHTGLRRTELATADLAGCGPSPEGSVGTPRVCQERDRAGIADGPNGIHPTVGVEADHCPRE